MTDAPDAPLTYELDGNVAVIRFDDGKANILGHDVIDTIHALLTRAEADEARDLLRAGAELALRIYMFPMPVLLAATGHALAMGAILLMAADVRIGGDGPFKIGLPEVEIGMPLPIFAVEFARDRLSKRHFLAATQHAVVTPPAEAVDVSFLDRVVPLEAVEAETIAAAHDLADRLHSRPFVLTRENIRVKTARAIQAGLDADMAAFEIEA
jgi:enoyl-CoA hydratase